MARYKLHFDDGHVEYIDATSSTEAVANREATRLPHTITDLTAMSAWVQKRGTYAHKA